MIYSQRAQKQCSFFILHYIFIRISKQLTINSSQIKRFSYFTCSTQNYDELLLHTDTKLENSVRTVFNFCHRREFDHKLWHTRYAINTAKIAPILAAEFCLLILKTQCELPIQLLTLSLIYQDFSKFYCS